MTNVQKLRNVLLLLINNRDILMSKESLNGKQELESINTKYNRLNSTRKKVAIGSKIVKKTALISGSSTALVSVLNTLESLTGIEGLTETAHKLISSYQNETTFKLTELITGTLTNAITEIKESPEQALLLASALGACFVADRWCNHSEKDYDKARFALDYLNSPFHKAFKDMVSGIHNSDYQTFTQELSKAASNKAIFGEAKGQKYSDITKIDDIELGELKDFLLGAGELTDFVINGDSEVAQFLRAKCEELMLSKSNMEAYLSLEEVREHLIKSRSGSVKAHVFINEYVNSLEGFEKEVIVIPRSGTSTIENQFNSLKLEILYETKEICDANFALNAFANKAYDVIHELRTDDPSADRTATLISDLSTFERLTDYKDSNERWSPLYKKLADAAHSLIDDIAEDNMDFTGFHDKCKIDNDQVMNSPYGLSNHLAATMDQSKTLSRAKSHNDFLAFSCHNIIEDRIYKNALNEKSMSHEDARQYAQVKTAMIDSKVAHLELSHQGLRYQKITRKNDSFIRKLARKISIENDSGLTH
ncbi:hypothetical protein [Vibrio owensii]|uniref:hypothetical protein n=1 Tax=Vibrio owensii TaxID=696485 RepID=UPI003CC6B8BB